MIIFGTDASSFQRNVNWAATDEVTAFGAEKCTEGVNYVNPFWQGAKALMALRAKATGFIPIAYLYLDVGSGAAAADWFAQHAGNLNGFGIAVDLERAPNGSPTLAEARDCVARLRHHYPDHRIGLYAPHWYTGSGDVSFGDWLWASNYVTAHGQSPAALYGHVSDAQWAAYGGETPTLLQFTDTAVVPGVVGACDCSAFRGHPDELAAIILPAKEHHVNTEVIVTDGTLSFVQLARKHHMSPAHLCRLNGGPDKPFTKDIAGYIDAGRLDVPMSPSIRVRVIKKAAA